MGSTITRRSSEHTVAAAGSDLLDASGAPARNATLLLEWRPAQPVASHGRLPREMPPAPRGLVDLESGEAAVLRVTGPDREAWIQGVQTADVRAIAAFGAAPTLVLNARGRTLAQGLLWRNPDELLLVLPRARLEPIRAHLEALLIMEDAELAIAAGLRHLRLSPGGAHQLLERLASLPSLTAPTALRGTETPLGFELLCDDKLADPLLQEIAERPDTVESERYRVALGVPQWGVDFDADSTPLEAGLDACIAFGKGCYVGQEVIAMATYRGRVPWHLMRLEVTGDAPPVGSALGARGGKGRVTSSVASGTGVGADSILLGIIHREEAEPGAQVPLADGRLATVLGLPFGSTPGRLK